MRAYEILLEYNRQVTLRNLGPKLLAVLSDKSNVDNGIHYDGPKKMGLSDSEILDTIMSQFEKSDPSLNKQFVPWIVREYIKRNIHRLEDLEPVHNMFKKYIEYKRDPDFDKNYNDIMKVSYLDLTKYLNSFKPSNNEEGKYTIVYKDNDIFIVQLGDLKSSKFWAAYGGDEAIWCTRYPDNFKRYTESGPLYVILNIHKPSDKYQIHFPTLQLKDRNDEDVDLNELQITMPGIKQYFSKIIPEYNELVMTTPALDLEDIWNTMIEISVEKIKGITLSNSYMDDDFLDHIKRSSDPSKYKNPSYRLEQYLDFNYEPYDNAIKELSNVRLDYKFEILNTVSNYLDDMRYSNNPDQYDSDDHTIRILPSVFAEVIKDMGILSRWVNGHVGVDTQISVHKQNAFYHDTIPLGKYVVYYDEDVNKRYSYYVTIG